MLPRSLPVLATAWLAACPAAQDAPVDFDRDVRPLLADRCYACHGPDAADREAGLRLDVPDVATAALPSGHIAVVPGDPERSELFRRITAADPAERMPPADSGLGLDATEIDVLRRWIAAGAVWEEHWSFRPLPAAVPVPETESGDWPRNEIDHFVRAAADGAAPTPRAAAERLLRRAHLTLTGLPPAPADLDAFRADPSDAGLDAVIDRLLASPRHAEHMASWWLDTARYADTYGYQSDVHREVWPWRDWVIDAFARDLPYDDFVVWQLAGDLLPDATREQRLATAFQRLHRQTNEGGSVEEEYRVESVADRVHTYGTAFLGLTLECARCHDHKFDPIPQRDYYRLFAFFDDIDESGLYSHFTNAVPTPALDLPTTQQEQLLAELDATRRAAEAALDAPIDGFDAAFAAWRDGDPPTPPAPSARFRLDAIGSDRSLANAADGEPGRAGGAARAIDLDGRAAVELDGDSPLTFPKAADLRRDDPFTIALWLRPAELHDRAVILHRSRAWTDAGSRGYELLLEDGRPSAALIHFWPGDAIRVRAREPLPVGAWSHVAITYDGSSRAAGLRLFVDGAPAEVDVIRDRLARTIRGGGAQHLTIGERFRDRGLRGGAVADLCVARRPLAQLEIAALREPSSWAAAWRDTALDAAWREVFVARHPERRARCDALRAARIAHSDAADGVRQIMTMRALAAPRTATVLRRGRYDQPGEAVTAGTPACLPPLPDARADRLTLARWTVDPDHPLTARVIVNRIWQMHFGRGLVATPEDFGSQGARPSHPELLDWLARRFVDSGWSLRALHRQILRSATWRQDSTASPAAWAADPDNERLQRGPRYRLPAEAIRDAALFASDTLVEQVGGPSVRPWQPDGLWREKSGATYHRQPGDPSRRRSLYTYWKRTSPPPAMMLLDAAKRDVCAVRRQRTSTPLQALLIWNDPQYVDAARHLAATVMRETDTADARLERLFVRALSRPPRADELAELRAAWSRERDLLRASPTDATAYLTSTGDFTPPGDLDPAELGSLALIAGTLFSLDEAMTLR